MDVTPRKRSKIVSLSEHTSMTQRQIASECGVGLGTVNAILKQFKETGSFSPRRKGKCGRKRKTTATQDRLLVRKSKVNPKLTAVDLNRELAAHGTNLHVTTVRRRLLDAGRKARRPAKKQLLTPAMCKKRLLWAKELANWTVEDWKNVMFSDESHFYVQGQRVSYVRKAADEKTSPAHIQQSVKHPQKKMFWGCFTFEGPCSLVPVDGMLKSDEYIKILKSRVVPQLQKKFPHGNGVFQQDLAPCHTAKKVKTFFEQENIKVLSWPGNSPDLSPIENLWAIVKNRLSKMDCTTKNNLISAIIKVWFHDEQIKKMYSTLIESMPNRIHEVIKNKGGHISY